MSYEWLLLPLGLFSQKTMAVGGMVMLVLVNPQRLSVILVLVTCLLLLCRCSSSDAKKHAKQLEACDKPEYERPTSFMWKTQSDPPSFFFGTIHVPYSRVWDYVPDNVKRAFEASDSVFFELDLTDPYTIAALTSCQLLPHGQSLADILPSDLYRRLKRHLEYVKVVMPSWMSADQRGRGMYADYLFNAITGNWERKRPVWVMLMVNSLTESDVKSRGVPVLDLYLAQEAERRNKRTGAVERVEEQCVPLNGLNFTQVVFALNQTLHHQESLRSGEQPAPFTTDDLIKHYNCGNLDAVMFNQDAAQVPSISNVTLAPYEQMMAKTIDDYFRRELIFKRNQRMGERVLELLKSHPNESFFFAFGAGHFLGSHTVLDVVSQAGYVIDHVTPHQRLRHKKKKRIFAVPAVLVPEPSVIRDFSLSSNNLDSKDDFFSHYLSRLAAAKPALTTKALGLLPTQARSTPNLSGARHRDKLPMEAGPTAAFPRKHHNFNDLWVRLESIKNNENGNNNEVSNEDINYHPRNLGIQPESLAEDSAKIETSLKVWYGLPVNSGGVAVALGSNGWLGLFTFTASVFLYILA